MRFTLISLLLLAVLLLCSTAHAKEQLMVRDLEAQRVDTVTAKALSDIIKSALGDYYSVQSMDALAALSSVVEEKLKAGCDDTKCLIEVAGAMDIGLVVTGSISKLGSLYTLNMQLISTRGANLGVVQRASDKCTCSDEELVGLAERVALQLIGKALDATFRMDTGLTPPSTSNAQKDYDRAMRLYYDRNYEQAHSSFEFFAAQYPTSELTQKALFWIGMCLFQQRNYRPSIAVFEDLIKKFPQSTNVPDAYYWQAMAFIEQKDMLTAQILLEFLMQTYPGTEASEKARQKHHELNFDKR